MGGSFSTVDYREQIIKYQTTFLSQEDNDSISAFLLNSEDFYNVFTTCTLDDFRKIKEEKSDNIIYLISYVCFIAPDLSVHPRDPRSSNLVQSAERRHQEEDGEGRDPLADSHVSPALRGQGAAHESHVEGAGFVRQPDQRAQYDGGHLLAAL